MWCLGMKERGMLIRGIATRGMRVEASVEKNRKMRYYLRYHCKEELIATEEENKRSTNAAVMLQSDISEEILALGVDL